MLGEESIIMADEEIEKAAKLLHEATQQGRKLDLLLAEVERQSERLHDFEESRLAKTKRKPPTPKSREQPKQRDDCQEEAKQQ